MRARTEWLERALASQTNVAEGGGVTPVMRSLQPPFSVIYADPPWKYADRGCQGTMAKHYNGMDIEELKRLDVRSVAAENSVLFMWATYPFLKEALELIEAWGFTYKTIAFVWIKQNRKGNGYFFGLGRWTRGNAEPCLLATRGKPKRASDEVSQLIFSPLTRHSEKPHEVRDKIVELIGDVPRIELFARHRVAGWACWGNEVESDIELTVAAINSTHGG